MEKHDQTYCPRCGTVFTCKTGDITNCQCNTVEMTEATAEFLATTFYDCLCRNCLPEMEDKIRAAAQYRFPTQKEMFIEGLHFYKDDGRWVFTEVYHILKGYCCRNGCRHCPYGYQKKKSTDED